jgi:hypothetical protein
MQPGNIGRPSACRFQRGEALISSCSDQGHGHHRQRHVRVKAKLDPKPVKLHWCRTVSRWPRASEEDAALGFRQSRSSRARFSAGRHGSARGCPGNATARSPSASPTPYQGLDRQRRGIVPDRVVSAPAKSFWQAQRRGRVTAPARFGVLAVTRPLPSHPARSAGCCRRPCPPRFKPRHS